MSHRYSYRIKVTGFSLVELLVAMTIGLLLLLGLSLILVSSSESNRELQKSAQQIENGRFAIDTLTQNIHHAGFYGHLFELPPLPTTLPDPCETSNLTLMRDALALPIQGYRAPDLNTIPDVTASTCDDKGLLNAANLRPGSDVVVIRRAATQALPTGTVPLLNDAYILSTGKTVVVQAGTAAAITDTSQVDGTTACTAGRGFCMQNNKTAPIRKYVVHVYFVAPCSTGSGANGVCASGDSPVPTLKRLELVAEGGVRTMKIVPLVEGIEYLKAEYGIDNVPGTASPVSGLIGDGAVDSFTASPTLAEFSNVVNVKIFLLARNTEATLSHTDTKTYRLGSITPVLTTAATNDQFKRHAYSAYIRLVNPTGRKEIP